jgi:hypothetical protein
MPRSDSLRPQARTIRRGEADGKITCGELSAY